jgi:hypothetical protein
MSFQATCPGCGAAFTLSDEFRDKSIRCKHCAEVFHVGAAGRTPEEPRPVSEPAATALQTAAGRAARATVEPLPAVRRAPSDERRPPDAESSGTMYVWIAVAVGAVLLVLAVVGVAGVGVIWFAGRPAPTTAAYSRPTRGAPDGEMAQKGPMPVPDVNPPVQGPQPVVLPENERPDPPANKPFAADPKLAGGAGDVYLSDMQEFAWTPGPFGWSFAKNGELGSTWAQNGVIVVKGVTPRKGLSMHPPDNGSTRVCYALGRRAQTLRGSVGISEDERVQPNPTRFIILGDGKVLWRSDSIRALGTTQPFSVDVSEVDVLELRVYVETGSCFGSHAAWIDPVLKRKGP